MNCSAETALYELASTRYEQVGPLFPDIDLHLAVKALLEGKVPGKVYANAPAQPQAAVAWVGHRFYLGGSPHDEDFNRDLGRFFAGTLYPQGVAAGQEGFVVKCTVAEWAQQIAVLLPGKAPIPLRQHYYCGRDVRYDWRAMLPPGMALRPVDRALLAEGLEGLDDLLEEMQSERPSVEEFLDKSFGFVPVQENTIIGWCLSEYNCGDRCEVGIATAEQHRRRGLATLVGTAFVEYALAHGITHIGWHCNASNAPSAATALKLGFAKGGEYLSYLCLFDEAARGAGSS